jgi:putative transposase
VRKHPSQSGPTRKLDRQRVRRWQQRHTTSRLDDQPPGGNPIHCILEWESAAVIELFEECGKVDLSHRKLAHRCWYLERGWVSPSTVDRTLARHDLSLKGEPDRRAR